MTTLQSLPTICTLSLPGVEIRFIRTRVSSVSRLIVLLTVWRRRLEGRRAIRELTSEQIADLDLDPFLLRREAEKPFWRA